MKWIAFFLSLGMAACASAPKFAKSFATPEETFKTWQYSAKHLDLQLLAECYSDSTKTRLRRDVAAMTTEGLKAVRDETRATDFSIEKIVYEDRTAYLRVRRSQGRTSDIEVLTMIKEKGQWKLIP